MGKNNKKAGKTQEQKVVAEKKSFLYLIPEAVLAKDLSQVLTFVEPDAIEVWTEVNLLELTTETVTVTFEDIKDSLRKEDLALLDRYGVTKVYACDYEAGAETFVKRVMTTFMDAFGGKMGSDTEDFEPFLKLDDLA